MRDFINAENIIKQLRISNIPRVEREGLWRLLLINYPFRIQNIDRKNSNYEDGKRRFFRVQKGKHYDIKRMLPLPNGDSRIKLGRANYEGESLLYCTDFDFYSCMLELVDRNTQDIQSITAIEFINKIDLKAIPVGLIDREKYTELLIENGVEFNEKEYGKYQLISEFMDNEFRLRDSYLNSSVLSKIIREEFPHINGVRYKTVRGYNFSHRGLNYAFSVNSFDDYFEITNCMQIEFKWFENKRTQFEQHLISTGLINSDGSMSFDNSS